MAQPVHAPLGKKSCAADAGFKVQVPNFQTSAMHTTLPCAERVFLFERLCEMMGLTPLRGVG